MTAWQSKYDRERGQVILVLLVLMALGLTIGLLTISRSTVDIDLSSKIEREARVFSANEAGVEDILTNPLSANEVRTTTINNIVVVAQSQSVSAAGDPFAFPDIVPQGDTQNIWLVPHKADNTLDESGASYSSSTIDVCWSKEGSTVPGPGMVISLIYKQGAAGDYKIARGAYKDRSASLPANCNAVQSPPEDCFLPVTTVNSSGNECGTSDTKFIYRKTLDFKADLGVDPSSDPTIKPLALRLRPVYAGAQIAVKPPPGSSLPGQTINNALVSAQYPGSGEATKIKIVQPYSGAAPVFDYALFSGKDLKHE